MGIKYDESGNIILDKLKNKDRQEIFNKTRELLEASHSSWKSTYGPLEQFEGDAADAQSRLAAVDENLIWIGADLNGRILTPVPGLELSVNGWGYLPGFSSWGLEPDEIETFFVGSKAWTDSPADVFQSVEIQCPFCFGSGDLDDDECETCEGEGTWEFELE